MLSREIPGLSPVTINKLIATIQSRHAVMNARKARGALNSQFSVYLIARTRAGEPTPEALLRDLRPLHELVHQSITPGVKRRRGKKSLDPTAELLLNPDVWRELLKHAITDIRDGRTRDERRTTAVGQIDTCIRLVKELIRGERGAPLGKDDKAALRRLDSWLFNAISRIKWDIVRKDVRDALEKAITPTWNSSKQVCVLRDIAQAAGRIWFCTSCFAKFATSIACSRSNPRACLSMAACTNMPAKHRGHWSSSSWHVSGRLMNLPATGYQRRLPGDHSRSDVGQRCPSVPFPATKVAKLATDRCHPAPGEGAITGTLRRYRHGRVRASEKAMP